MFAAALFFFAQLLLAPCTIEGVSEPTHCGSYRVWENRATKQGREINLSVTVLNAATEARQPDPLFVLAGGPGDAPSFNANFFSRVFANTRQTRDVVLVDLRGTGKSNPLTCPELGQPDAQGRLDPDILSVNAVKTCRARLEKTNDLRQYTAEIAVEDLDEVRRALGYGKINLYGTSYGTRVAQVYMRRHPASLRSVTMKGVVPASMASPETHARAGQNAWEQLVSRCLKDDQCKQNFPTPDVYLQTILKRLESSPVLPLDRMRNGVKEMTVSTGLFAEAFRFYLYSPENEVRGLKFLKEVAEGRPGLAEYVLSTRNLLATDRLAAGFFLSVSCAEDVPYLPKELRPLFSGTLGGDYRLRQQIDACSVWPKGEVSSQHRKPTRSNIPTLLISGEFDPVTPPSGGEEVLKGLTRGLHIVVRNNGHPIGSAEQCSGNMIGSFIERGSVADLDSSCAAKIPAIQFKL